MNKIELLTPAKDLECGLAAINSGADAVYIGANRFGARSNAGNSICDIENICKYAHKYWAKVYVTLNTILYDNELEEAEKLIKQIYEIGADGLIIQDMGILEMNLPPIPIIASTQAHNATWQKVDFLEKVGFHRVILARELTLKQIVEIKSKTTIELEAFVHGALCVCYSGQCYLSQAIGGRSGNRGECAQPCRLKYDLVDSNNRVIVKNKHLLSLRDLNLSEHLYEMVQAGITSFKIEGRLKDITYVKNTVAYYRNKLDTIFEQTDFCKASTGTTNPSFIPDLNKTFNRGYTTYFFNGLKEDITSFDTPKSKGEYIGKISKITNNYIQIESEKILNNGDGICFFINENEELTGTKINKVEGFKIFPDSLEHLKPGKEIYRNFDIHFNSLVKNDKSKRRINVNIIIIESELGFILEAEDENSLMVTYEVICKKETAENITRISDTIKKQLAKSGDTIFNIMNVSIQIESIFFIPISILNEARRKILELLEEKRIILYKRIQKNITPNNYPYPVKDLTYLNNISNRKAKDFYEKHGSIVHELAFEIDSKNENLTVMKMKHCLKFSIGECPKYNVRENNKNTEMLYLKDERKKLQLDFNCTSCDIKIKLLDL